MPELGTYTVSILLQAQENISKAVKNAVNSLNQLENESRKLSSSLSDVGKIALGVVSGLIGFNIFSEVRRWVDESIQAFVRFESASVRLASLAREAGQSVEGLAAGFRVVASAAARELAVTGQEAITALEGLVKAGLSGRDAALALRDAIMLARIEGVDFASASNSLVQVMAQFGIAGNEAKRVVDALINASRLGIGSANDFAQGLANVGATARAMGMGLEETTSWLVVLERRFGSAQEAGTHLNRFLLELYDIAGKLGVPIRDLQGNLRSTSDIMLDVINVVKTSGMGFDQLQEKLKGVDMRALKALFTFTQMTENIRELTEEVSRSGSAWETYKKYLETTEGRMAALRAENDRMMRSIGEGASSILSMVAPAFLKAGDAIISAWRSIIGTITGTNLERYLGYVEFRVRVLGNASEEAAAEWIKSWVDMGQMTLSEGLKIAESVGIYNETIQELIDRAVEAGVAVPESFQAMASNATTSSQQTVNALKSIEEQMKSLEKQVKILSSTFDLLSKGVGLAEGFYDVTVKVMRALGYDVELSDEARESKERLAATQQVLNYIMNAYGLVQEALKLRTMGATEASDMLLNSFNLLISATEDGVVTNQEFIDILRQLGVDAGNVAGSLHSVLKTALEATKSAIQGNIDAVNSFIASLKNLDGMTVHTYHYHHIITVKEGGVIAPPVPENIKEITETLKEWAWQPEAVPPLQRGLWYVPRDDYIARLHRGEMVLPRNVAEWFRSRGPVAAQKTVNVNVNVNAGSVSDPNLLAEIVSRKLVQRLRAM
ncbi:MAG: phage tail tape measure protein [Thaumarchaeota archaeon]|jgi:TP901 family phage tail tape measure protein|nr:phage tail tape measure protein [Candidatus Geocrenenecus arthurdayi]